MADTKISALTSATTPLTGTEVLPLVQSGTTKKVSVAGLMTSYVYAIVDGASVDIDPANGGIQTWTLGANRTPTATNFAAGQAVTLMIADGTAYAVTWTTIGVVWVGGTAPTLPTTGYGVIELWKAGSTVYGAYVGAVA